MAWADRFGRDTEATRQEVRLEDRLKHDLHSGLHDPASIPRLKFAG